MPSRAARAAALAAVVSLQLILCVASMRNDSATDDEPAHIAVGLMETRFGRVGMLESQPPLLGAVAAAALAPLHFRLPADWFRERQPWRLGRSLLYHAGNDADALLFAARIPSLLFFVALTLLTWAWCWSLTRNFAASIASAALVAFCPNLIAHGRVITADAGATFLIFAATFAFLRWLEKGGFAGAALAGLLLAAAVLMKISAVILVPWMIVLFYVRALQRPLMKKDAGEALTLVLAAGAVFEIFCLIEMRSLDLAAPFREYLRMITLVQQYYGRGHVHPQFLFGTFSTGGWWYYYPAAFLLKATIPALLLIAASLAVIAWRFRLRSLHAIGLTAFVVLFGGALLKSEVDVGVRYMLPLVPFIYLGVGLSIHRAMALYGRRIVLIAVAALLCWHTGEAVATYPNYIGYFNEFIGSNANADRYLIDSNLDWGQDLKRLAQWADAHHVDRLRIDYFGGGDPAYYMPGKAIAWSAPRPEPLPPGYFALSRHFYRTSFFYRDYGMTYDQYLAGARKVATVNGSMDVYRIEN